jgi:hypothetical protein
LYTEYLFQYFFQFILLGFFKQATVSTNDAELSSLLYLLLLFFVLSYCIGLKISNLIASEIIRNEDVNARVSAIEKWVAVADICRCLHNYNAVLEITSSMNRSAIFRLKKTWLKVSKQVRAGGWHCCSWDWARVGTGRLEGCPLGICRWAHTTR